MSTKAENELNRAVRAYYRERIGLILPTRDSDEKHAEDCVRVFVAAALIDERDKLASRVVKNIADYADGK